MTRRIRVRFWIELAAAVICAVLLAVTLVWKDWIEIVFGVDPDAGNGSLEWLIVGASAVVALLLASAAGYEFRRATPRAAG
jgi:succinate dehydrogenase hydrophobic anchor subunit